ncbi:hypothetical protein ACJ41O_010282 [Fusarium nematophilum]
MASPKKGPGPAVVLVSSLAPSAWRGPITNRTPEASRWGLIALAAAAIIARVYLRLRIQRRRLLSSDILMFLAWCAALAAACFDVMLARMGALEPQVMTNLEGYEGTPEQISILLRVRDTTTRWSPERKPNPHKISS